MYSNKRTPACILTIDQYIAYLSTLPACINCINMHIIQQDILHSIIYCIRINCILTIDHTLLTCQLSCMYKSARYTTQHNMLYKYKLYAHHRPIHCLLVNSPWMYKLHHYTARYTTQHNILYKYKLSTHNRPMHCLLVHSILHV